MFFSFPSKGNILFCLDSDVNFKENVSFCLDPGVLSKGNVWLPLDLGLNSDSFLLPSGST